MSIDFVHKRFETRSTREWLERVRDDMLQSRSVIVLARDPEDGLAWHLPSEVSQRGLTYDEVYLDDLDAKDPPAAALGKALGIGWPEGAARTVRQLLASRGLHDVVFLHGLDRLPDESARKDWLDLASGWGEAAQALVGTGQQVPVMCMICDASKSWRAMRGLKSNVRLAIHWMWGTPSALEVQLLCRGEHPDRVRALWREHVIPAVACDDLALAGRLWDETETPQRVFRLLADFARDRGWTASHLEQFGLGDFEEEAPNGKWRAEPSQKSQPLWARGLLHATLEYGVEVHSAALAAMGRHEDVYHRVWRGQAALLLPMLDGIRLRICKRLTRVHREAWAVQWQTPLTEEETDAVRHSPLACEWGHLETLLRLYPTQLYAGKGLLGLVEQCRYLRNQLAHNRPVTFGDFESVYLAARGL